MKVKRKHEMGAGGHCVCPKCNEKTTHHEGIPCQDERCSNCGVKLLREGAEHHKLFQQKQEEKRKRESEE